jgi:hypothetical protein
MASRKRYPDSAKNRTPIVHIIKLHTTPLKIKYTCFLLETSNINGRKHRIIFETKLTGEGRISVTSPGIVEVIN